MLWKRWAKNRIAALTQDQFLGKCFEVHSVSSCRVHFLLKTQRFFFVFDRSLPLLVHLTSINRTNKYECYSTRQRTDRHRSRPLASRRRCRRIAVGHAISSIQSVVFGETGKPFGRRIIELSNTTRMKLEAYK